LLVGVTLLTPLMSSHLLRRIGSATNSSLALARLRNAPGETAASIAPIIVSFSLVVAMAVMVTSFRGSVAEWVAQVTPADLYLRAAHGGDTGFFDERAQRIIAATPGIARAEFLFATQVVLDPQKPPIALLTRPVTREFLTRTLPLVGQSRTPQPGEPPPVWVSEQARDAYTLTPGKLLKLPIGGHFATFTVAGISRDYARERGSLLIDRAVYVELTGDGRATDAALYLAPGADTRAVERSIKTGLGADRVLEVGAPHEIRALTMQIFDRSFYVTYALEAIALVIALFGVASAFAAQALARRAEFGVLRHVGATRSAVHRIVATEGAIACTLGAAIGMALGLVISLILIHVVNRQSFHWSMDISVPWAWLALSAVVLILAGSLTAAFAARQATGASALEAVRSD
jgi:putative ABC transport system permease protein